MNNLLLLLFALVTIVRFLRWAALTQQKEYRPDRLWEFVSSPAGKQELLHLIPTAQMLTRAGLKRPKITIRSVLVSIFALLLLLAILMAGQSFTASLQLHPVVQLISWSAFLLSTYVLIPALFFIAMLPTTIARSLVVIRSLSQARTRLALYPGTVIIGITGSYGKTSTKLLLAHVLNGHLPTFATPRSHNNLLSVARAVVAGFIGQSVAIIEYGAYTKGDIARLASWIQPNLAIITGFTVQHIGLFGNEQAIIAAKSELVKALPSDSKVYYAGDNVGVRKIVEQGSQGKKLKKINYATLLHSQITDIQLDRVGRLSFRLAGILVKTQLIGTHYLNSCAASIMVARDLGLSNELIAERLASFVPSDNFVRQFVLNKARVIDDGLTTNPEGFEQICKLVSQLPGTRSAKHLIFGGVVDLGSKTSEVHLKLAQSAAHVFETVGYVGQVGDVEFKQVLGERCITLKSIEDALPLFSAENLIVFEGKMPIWLVEYSNKSLTKVADTNQL